MLAAIAALFTALPDLIKGITALAQWVQKKIKEDPTFFQDMGKTFEQLNQSKTADEHMQSASDLSKLIRRI